MKIIEGLKKVKDLYRKYDDIQKKVHTYCANLNYETPAYPDQKAQVDQWIQACHDLLKEISTLQYAIQKTNIQTTVDIELEGKMVSKTIAEWILRRKKLIPLEEALYKHIGDRGLREGSMNTSSGETTEVKIRRYYDPKDRDKKLSALMSEPSLIDSKLEMVNAVTDLVK